jgi:hypothetical protein
LFINGDSPDVNRVSNTNVSHLICSAVYHSCKSEDGSIGHFANCASDGSITSQVLISYRTGIGIPNFLFLEIFRSRCRFSIQSFDLFFINSGNQFIFSFCSSNISFLSSIFTNRWCTGIISTGTLPLSEIDLDCVMGVTAFTTHFDSNISIIFTLASLIFSQSISSNPVFSILPYLLIQILGSRLCF